MNPWTEDGGMQLVPIPEHEAGEQLQDLLHPDHPCSSEYPTVSIWMRYEQRGLTMTMARNDFPSRERLWRGAALATIAHAIFIAADPALSWELSWDGPNYSRQDSMGT